MPNIELIKTVNIVYYIRSKPNGVTRARMAYQIVANESVSVLGPDSLDVLVRNRHRTHGEFPITFTHRGHAISVQTTV